MITLVQTGKAKPRPILLMEPKGSRYWKAWKRFIDRQLARRGFIDKEDFNLFRIVKSVDEAVRYIDEFYRVYHSIRYTSGVTVLRLVRPISDKTLKLINQRFKDILTSGGIEPSSPTKEEIHRGEHLDLPRLVMKFNKRDYGKLCAMIHIINKDQA
jgi:hypothetical protein